ESTINFANIADYVYDILLEYKNINDDFEGMTKFQVKFNINFELICEVLIDATEQDRNLHISNSIVNAVSNGDGYTYVYQSKYNSKKQDYISFTYWSSITIKIDFKNNIVLINISYDLLHLQSEKVNVMKKIKDYINNCIQQSVPEIYQSIKDQHIEGYEFLTIKQ
ncbi:9525_t:CDS:2, partial [Racocetra persica]